MKDGRLLSPPQPAAFLCLRRGGARLRTGNERHTINSLIVA
jgi:hypothetical protein